MFDPRLHKTIRLIILLLALCVQPVSVNADPRVIELDDRTDFFVQAGHFVEYRHDRTGHLSASEAVLLSDWQDLPSEYSETENSRGATWLRLRLHSHSKTERIWRLDLRQKTFRELDVFVARQATTPETILNYSLGHSYHHRPIDNTFLAADMTLQENEMVDIYIRYVGSYDAKSLLRVASPEKYRDVYSGVKSGRFAFYGALGTILVVALLALPVIGWRLVLAFSLYMLTAAGVVLDLQGTFFAVVFRNDQELALKTGGIFPLLCVISLQYYTAILFAGGKKSNVIRPIRVALIGSLAGIGILFWFSAWPLPGGLQILKYAGIGLGLLAYLGLAGTAALERSPGSLPVFVGALICIVTLATILVGTSVWESVFGLGESALRILILSEATLFALAMMQRTAALRKERDEALKSELVATQKRLQLKEELEKSRRDYDYVRRLSDQRQNTLNMVSHDIAQPLLSLRVSLRQLESEDAATVSRMNDAFEYLETLTRRHMTADITSLEPGLERDSFEVFPIDTVTDNVVAMFRDEVSQKKLALRYRPLRAKIEADPIKIMRLISNLFANAVKYTSEGGVLLGCRLRGDHLLIQIVDTGIGMTVADSVRFTEAGEKGNTSDGAGLGLSIVRSICTEFGYSLKISSKPGRGTTISVKVPIAPSGR